MKFRLDPTAPKGVSIVNPSSTIMLGGSSGGGGGAVDSVNGQTGVVNLDTDDISEGVNNLYYTEERVYDEIADILIAGTNITLNEDDINNTITINASGGGGGATDAVTKNINQTTHGFSVGDVVRLSGGSYVEAQADSDANAEVVGIVSTVTDANNFVLTTHGYMSGLSGLTAGVVYYLSEATAGLLTSTEPSVVGNISKPVFVATSTTAGYVINYRGVEVTSGSGGTVDSVVAGTNIDVDSTDPANPIVSVESLTLADISDVTASASEVNILDGATLTTTELNYVDGVTSAIQTQLNAKGTGDVTAASNFGTDNALIRADGTGKGVQSSTVTLSDGTNPTLTATSGQLRLEGASSSVGVSIQGLMSVSDSGVYVSSPSNDPTAVVNTNAAQTLTNKTLTTPTIASFANAGHNHQNAAGGGTLANAALTNSSITVGSTSISLGATATTLAGLTLTTPTIASFANANHNHTNSAGGGQLTDAALSSAVTVGKGGTGVGTLTSGNVLVGAGTSAVTTTKAAPTGAFVGTTDSQTLTNKLLSTATTFDNNIVPAAALATSAITLGYTEISTDFTTSSASATQVTGLTSTVTIPSGGRRVRITAYVPRVTTSGVTTIGISIWDGTVGSGTLLTDFNPTSAGGVAFVGGTASAVVSPSAGSKTYNIGILSTAGNSITANGATTGKKMYILVEAI